MVDWQGVVEPLKEGMTYTICGYGRYTIDGVGSRDTGSCFDADQTGRRASTTIDLTKPTIGVSIDSGAAYSKSANLHYRIDYADNLAFPFPANFLCRDVGHDPATACDGVAHQYNEACSVPAGGMKKVAWFDCMEDLGTANIADGPVTLCAVSADAAIPDNPDSSNQSGSATSANLSTRACDSITVDRTAPMVSVAASGTMVTAGDLSFTAQASDATSGLSGNYAWTWGDNTTGGTGSSATHTFTAPGTYEVPVTTADGAGNPATAKKVVTVQPRPADGGGASGGASGGSTPGGTTSGGTTSGGTATGGTTSGGPTSGGTTTGGTTSGGTTAGGTTSGGASGGGATDGGSSGDPQDAPELTVHTASGCS